MHGWAAQVGGLAGGPALDPISHRVLVQQSWAECQPSKSAAVRRYRQLVAARHCAPLSRPDKALARWCERGTALAAPQPGRPPLIPDDLARKLAAAVKARWKDKHGAHRGFRSVAHAKEKSPAFAKLAAEAGGADATVLAAMKRVDPKLGMVTQRVKPLFSERAKKVRRRAATKLLRLGLRPLMAAEFIDEASYGFSRLSCKVLGDTSKGEVLVADNRAPRSYSDYTVLHFCIAINWVVGAHFIVWLTGTKGMQSTGYKVRALPWLLRAPAPCAPANHPACRPAARAHQTDWHCQCSTG